MVSLKNLFLFATAAAAKTLKEVNADVTAIDTNVKTLITQTSAYEGGFDAAAPLLSTLSAVYAALGSGVTDTGLLAPKIVSVADAYVLIDHVNATLAIDNPIAVNTLISKKKYFQEQGLDGAIAAALGLLKAGHDSFSVNVLARTPEAALADGKVVVKIIDDALQKGIDNFATWV